MGSEMCIRDRKVLGYKVKKAYKKGNRNLGEAWVHYKKLVKRYKKLCKKRRNASWKKYKETRQIVEDIVKLMKIIQQKKYNKVNTFTRSGGTSTDPREETLTELVGVHFPNAIGKIKKSYTSKNKLNRQSIEESIEGIRDNKFARSIRSRICR